MYNRRKLEGSAKWLDDNLGIPNFPIEDALHFRKSSDNPQNVKIRTSSLDKKSNC